MLIKTLVDSKKGIWQDCDRTLFCSTDKDGNPFLSVHSVHQTESDSLWIGQIFRDYPDEPYQIAIRGDLEVRGAWDKFEDAIAALESWWQEKLAKDLEQRRVWGLEQRPESAEEKGVTPAGQLSLFK